MDSTCLFCRIAAKQIPSKLVHEDEAVVAFHDVNPKAPTHVLIIPREHVLDLNDAKPEHRALLGNCLAVVAQVAKVLGVDKAGYRTVINTGADAGQSVFHLHLHLLAGRPLGWPPG